MNFTSRLTENGSKFFASIDTGRQNIVGSHITTAKVNGRLQSAITADMRIVADAGKKIILVHTNKNQQKRLTSMCSLPSLIKYSNFFIMINIKVLLQNCTAKVQKYMIYSTLSRLR